jgi:hypothetical protein
MCIHGVFKGIGEARLVKKLVLVRWKRDLKIAPWPWCIGAVTGQEKDQKQGKEKEAFTHLINFVL